MTIEEAIWTMENGAWWDSLNDDMSDADKNPLFDALDMAISALRAKREQESNEPKWISVNEMLPRCGERVLARTGPFVGEAYRTSAGSWYRQSGIAWRDALDTSVTHWMPMPHPPKGE